MIVAALIHSSEIHRLLATYGYVIVFAFVAVESLGVPVPGETTLTLAAIYAGTTHRLDIAGVIAVAAAGAVVGDNVGYAIGYLGGYRLLSRYGRFVRIDEQRFEVGRYLFDRHGGKVVFFGRFVSILRTYAAFLAGTTRMSWRRFVAFNAAGGLTWAAVYGIAYYYFGSALRQSQGAIDVGLAAFSVVVFVVVFVVLRHEERKLSARVADVRGPEPRRAACDPS